MKKKPVTGTLSCRFTEVLISRADGGQRSLPVRSELVLTPQPEAQRTTGVHQQLLFCCHRSISMNGDEAGPLLSSDEKQLLEVTGSTWRRACCSLAEGVINGSSHSVCSRQARLPPPATADDTRIAHSLAPTDELMAAPRRRDGRGGGRTAAEATET